MYAVIQYIQKTIIVFMSTYRHGIAWKTCNYLASLCVTYLFTLVVYQRIH